jgi:hypothetical protein
MWAVLAAGSFLIGLVEHLAKADWSPLSVTFFLLLGLLFLAIHLAWPLVRRP